MRTIWSSAARRDVLKIGDYLADRNLGAAAEMVRAIYARADRVSDESLMGRVGRVEGTRERVIPGTHYLIVYRLHAGDLNILRVLHGAQQWPPEPEV